MKAVQKLNSELEEFFRTVCPVGMNRMMMMTLEASLSLRNYKSVKDKHTNSSFICHVGEYGVDERRE